MMLLYDVMKLHIGCGPIILEGWINIDRKDRKDHKGIDLTCDIRHGLPIDTATVDYIYSEHFIEHLTLSEASAFVIECRRVLKIGGTIRTATPCLDDCIAVYSGNWRDQEWLKKYPDIKSRGQMFNACFYFWEHRYIYNEQDLCELFVGFECKRMEHSVSDIVEFQNLESRPESGLILESIKC